MRGLAVFSAALAAPITVASIYWLTTFGMPAPVNTTPPATSQTDTGSGAAEPPRAPEKPTWNKAAALESAVTKVMEDFPGRYSVIVHQLSTGKQWLWNADARYHPASTIKMPVTLYALEQIRAGKLHWTDQLTYTSADYESPGGGNIETAPFGTKYQVQDLVHRALKTSNNIAVNMLGRHLGWRNIETWTRTIHGELYRLPDNQPEVTPMSELGWWLHFEKVTTEAPTTSRLLLDSLRDVAYTGRIPMGLPAGVKYLHKFGSFDGNFHDGGIVYASEPYIVVVMTNVPEAQVADEAIAQVSKAVYDLMK